LHDVTLFGLTVARFVGTGGFLIGYSNGNKKYTNGKLKKCGFIFNKTSFL